MRAILGFLLLFGVIARKRKREPDQLDPRVRLMQGYFSFRRQSDANSQNPEGDQCPNISDPTVHPAPAPHLEIFN